jgi:hypothetical protein
MPPSRVKQRVLACITAQFQNRARAIPRYPRAQQGAIPLIGTASAFLQAPFPWFPSRHLATLLTAVDVDIISLNLTLQH